MNYNECYLHSVTAYGRSGQFNWLLNEQHSDRGIDVSKLYLKRIELINKFGILSIDKQLELIGEDYKNCFYYFNGHDYVSLSYPGMYKEMPDLDPDDNDLNDYNNEFLSMSIVVSKDIDNYLEFRKQPFQRMGYEVQVKDQIPREYILGLRVPSLYSENGCNDKKYKWASSSSDVQDLIPIWEENIAFLQQSTDLPLIASLSGEIIPKTKILK